MPKVSIIMPSLNVAPYIRECIESVINQTLKDIEIICVDAGSTDGTLEILQEYAAQDTRIKLIRSEKKSYGYQMNLGIDIASGEYVGCVETDDYILPDMFEYLYKIISENKCDFVKADHYVITGDGDQRKYEYTHISKDQTVYNNIFNIETKPDFFITSLCYTWSGIYRTSFIRANNIRHNETPGASYQDTGFRFQIYAWAKSVYFVDKAFYMLRRDNPNSSEMSKEKVYFICDEYDFILNIYNRYPEIKAKMVPSYALRLHKSYMWNLHRIAQRYKHEFIWKMHDDYIEAVRLGNMDYSLYSDEQKKEVDEIIGDPEQFYFKKIASKYYHENAEQTEKLKNNLKNALNEVNAIKASWSFRIGYAITWLPRKIRGAVKCYKEHGLAYTIHQLLKKVDSKLIKWRIKRVKEKVGYGLNKEKRPIRIIVSLTSYPPRIDGVSSVICDLLKQTLKPDKIILWLASEQFPNKEKELPKNLLALRKYGLSIEWCADLKPHKKYYYALKQFPDDIVVTIDDDVRYDPDMLRTLYASYARWPYAVSALRTHQIVFSEDGSVAPYKEWLKEDDTFLYQPSMRVIATGVGGVLYTPNCLHAEVFNEEAIRNVCINADDLWLKIMSVMNNTPTVLAAPNKALKYIKDSQKNSLCKFNVDNNENDVQLNGIISIYNNFYGLDDTLINRLRSESIKENDFYSYSADKYQKEEPIKVLFLPSDNSRTSGAFISMATLIIMLETKFGVNAHVILPNKGNGEELLVEKGINYSYIRSFDWVVDQKVKKNILFRIKKYSQTVRNYITSIKIARFIINNKIDLIHSNTTYTYVGMLASRLTGRPIVWHLREFLEEDQGRTIWCKRYGYKLIKKADRVIAISQSLYEKYLPIINTSILKLIYNGVDSNVFYNSEKEIFTDSKLRLLFVGGLSRNKGVYELIDALIELIEKGHDNFEISFIGNASQAFHNKLKSSNLGIRAKHLGYIKNTHDYYSEADISFTCSRAEAFGRITVEAMLTGNLVIGANSGCTKEIITHGVTGLLYRQGSPHSLASAIIHAWTHKDEMRNIARKGREYAYKNLTAEINARNVYRIYHDLLEKNV